MYNINLDNPDGTAKVHLANSPIKSCKPRTKQENDGGWLLNQQILPPDGSIFTHNGRNYTVEHCRHPGNGCMRNP